MKGSLIIKLKELISGRSKKPWANIECNGFNDDMGIGFSMSWNQAFIRNLEERGFQGIDENETVNNFMLFCGAQMVNDRQDEINPDATPNLTSEANTFRR
jgi:hypothetical protein